MNNSDHALRIGILQRLIDMAKKELREEGRGTDERGRGETTRKISLRFRSTYKD